ncbi:MAG: zinc ribbon domain-containing protein [Rubrivivax sp.]|nr:zinc ribbon domain-containing protein [Rubrivivax sp.]
MPIYAYRCTACGHAQDVLQKMSDPVLTVCPACSASTYAKQLTAAGFQLKGSGWYVTDFRGGKTEAPKSAEGAENAAPATDKGDSGAEKSAEKTAVAAAPAAAPADKGGSPTAASSAKPGSSSAPASASAPASSPAPAASPKPAKPATPGAGR